MGLSIRARLSLLKWEMHSFPEKCYRWIAWRLPRKVAYWAFVRVGAHATTGKYENQIVPDLTVLKAMERWDK